jgi:hypothetical protein
VPLSSATANAHRMGCPKKMGASIYSADYQIDPQILYLFIDQILTNPYSTISLSPPAPNDGVLTDGREGDGHGEDDA